MPIVDRFRRQPDPTPTPEPGDRRAGFHDLGMH